MQKGRLKNLRRPIEPWYRDRHPDDHNLSKQKINYYISAFNIFNEIKLAGHYFLIPALDATRARAAEISCAPGAASHSSLIVDGWIARCSFKAGARARATLR